MTKTIFVVEGSTGEYSDHREWLVKAYTNETKAIEHILLASQEANKLFVKYNSDDYAYGDSLENKYDPYMQMDYTGVRYRYHSIELVEE
jgi:hypothetical protein